MKKSLFSTIVLALLTAVAVVSSTITVQAEQSADEKADSQADKDHIEQADKACQKDGFDGYIEGDCGNLN
jgi:peptidoglycan hydrolase CwlO-like protein